MLVVSQKLHVCYQSILFIFHLTESEVAPDGTRMAYFM